MWPVYLFICTSVGSLLAAATTNWANNVNVSICYWNQLRANIIGDTIYMDGGDLWWIYGQSDGQNGDVEDNGIINGTLFALDLGLSFDGQTNLTDLLTRFPEVEGKASQEAAPNYIDGAMFANNAELIFYGGLPYLSANQGVQQANRILAYEVSQHGSRLESQNAAFSLRDLPDGVINYITNGAPISAPSENLSFYFSGMHSPGWDNIGYGSISPNTRASSIANRLITVNMGTVGKETWANDSLPSFVPGRANAELVWIPVSDAGVLVAIGGVINPAILAEPSALTADQASASNRTSPTFMETVPIYDIANKKWYLQNTTGDVPPQLTLFCSSMAPAADGSSFNIYIYGGSNGINTNDAYDDVYILSIPSFTWIHAYKGSNSHGRYGHKCVKIYPDQMFVLGGQTGNTASCLGGGFIQVFNLNTLEFQEAYDPSKWNEYQVPEPVISKIGGNTHGSATKTAPPSWNTDDLATVFSSKYAKSIPTYYPYKPTTTSSTATATASSTTVPSHNGNHSLPHWVGPVLGVVLGLLVLAAIFGVWAFFRRRQYKSTYASNNSEARRKRARVLEWMYKTPSHAHKPSTAGASELEAHGTHATGPSSSDGAAQISSITSEMAADSQHGMAEISRAPAIVHELEGSLAERHELPN